MRVPGLEYAPPSLDEKRVGDEDQYRRGRDPFPSELNMSQSRLNFSPLRRQRPRGEEQHHRREDPLGDLEEATTR